MQEKAQRNENKLKSRYRHKKKVNPTPLSEFMYDFVQIFATNTRLPKSVLYICFNVSPQPSLQGACGCVKKPSTARAAPEALLSISHVTMTFFTRFETVPVTSHPLDQQVDTLSDTTAKVCYIHHTKTYQTVTSLYTGILFNARVAAVTSLLFRMYVQHSFILFYMSRTRHLTSCLPCHSNFFFKSVAL